MTVFQSWLVLAGSGGFFLGIGFGLRRATRQIRDLFTQHQQWKREQETSTFNRLRLEWTARAGEQR